MINIECYPFFLLIIAWPPKTITQCKHIKINRQSVTVTQRFSFGFSNVRLYLLEKKTVEIAIKKEKSAVYKTQTTPNQVAKIYKGNIIFDVLL